MLSLRLPIFRCNTFCYLLQSMCHIIIRPLYRHLTPSPEPVLPVIVFSVEEVLFYFCVGDKQPVNSIDKQRGSDDYP